MSNEETLNSKKDSFSTEASDKVENWKDSPLDEDRSIEGTQDSAEREKEVPLVQGDDSPTASSEQVERLREVAKKWNMTVESLLEEGVDGNLQICVFLEPGWAVEPGIMDMDPDPYLDSDPYQIPRRYGFRNPYNEPLVMPKGVLMIYPKDLENFLENEMSEINFVYLDPQDTKCVGRLLDNDNRQPKVKIRHLYVTKSEQERYKHENHLALVEAKVEVDLLKVMDTDHPYHSRMLEMAIKTWLYHYGEGFKTSESYTSEQKQDWLERNGGDGLSARAREEIVRVSNPDNVKTGGAPKKS